MILLNIKNLLNKQLANCGRPFLTSLNLLFGPYNERCYIYSIIKIKVMLEKSILKLAKELIELKFKVQIIDIQLEDGSGTKFVVTTTTNPLKKQFIKL
jgi:hypothetical protein